MFEKKPVAVNTEGIEVEQPPFMTQERVGSSFIFLKDLVLFVLYWVQYYSHAKNAIVTNMFAMNFKVCSIFRSRKKIFDYLYNRVVFFSRPFNENFKFLKNCPYDLHKILHSHSTPEGAPACARTSKSYDWDVRNIAKISLKMAKKQL